MVLLKFCKQNIVDFKSIVFKSYDLKVNSIDKSTY